MRSAKTGEKEALHLPHGYEFEAACADRVVANGKSMALIQCASTLVGILMQEIVIDRE